MRTTLPFSQYNGDTCFSFDKKTYYYKKNLGEGSFGSADLFESENPFSQVVVKSEKKHASGYGFGKTFQMEAQWCQQVYDLGVFSGDENDKTNPHYVLMPYFAGKMCHKMTYQSEKHMVQHWVHIAHATFELHEKHKAVHCDLKTDNVIINNNKAFIIDFGLMKKIGQYRDNMFDECSSNPRIFYHQPPEVFTPKRKAIAALNTQDFYSLGIVLFDMHQHYLKTSEEYSSENITTVRKNLTKINPKDRWSIAKAIYMLITTFFSQLSREIWESLWCDDLAHPINPASMMPNVWQQVVDIAILARIIELRQEQKTQSTWQKKINHKKNKIAGLKSLHSQIIVSDPQLFALRIAEAKIAFPELTAGIFSQRTKILLSEINRLAPVFI